MDPPLTDHAPFRSRPFLLGVEPGSRGLGWRKEGSEAVVVVARSPGRRSTRPPALGPGEEAVKEKSVAPRGTGPVREEIWDDRGPLSGVRSGTGPLSTRWVRPVGSRQGPSTVPDVMETRV